MKSNVVLLLTGCINPNGMSYTKVADVETRLNQYIEALDFYSKNIKCPIVFVENSNFDIMPYIEKSHIDTSNIEVLSFYGNDYDKSIGKGFGEALIIEYALKHSTYVLSADIVIKITGRIILDDIARIVSEVSEASSNTVFADVNWHKDYHDKLLSVIVAASPKFWLRFISKKDEIDDKKGVVFEKVLKETADGWLTNGGGNVGNRFTAIAQDVNKGRFSLFHTPLYYRGVSGSTGNSYARSNPLLKYYLKLLLFKVYLKRLMFRK